MLFVPNGVDSPYLEENYVLTGYINDVNTQYTQTLVEYGVSGAYDSVYEYGVQRTTMYQNSQVYSYEYDGRGSVSELVNSLGKTQIKYSYGAYGETVSTVIGWNNPVTNPYRYNAERIDDVAGVPAFQYLRARYLNPYTSSFLSQDSYLGSLLPPLSQNRYAYANNNPVMYIDPSGHYSMHSRSVTDYSRKYAESYLFECDSINSTDVAATKRVRHNLYLENVLAEAEKYANFDKCDELIEGLKSDNLLDPNTYRDWLEMRETEAWNYFHILVEEDIRMKNPLINPIEKNIPGVGRADLYSTALNQVWEVKPASYMLNVDKLESALTQVRRYATALGAGVGGGYIKSSSFTDPSGEYLVTYQNNQNGIITYNFKKREKEPATEPVLVPEKETASEPETEPVTESFGNKVANYLQGGMMILGAFGLGVYIFANDATGVGVADDPLGIAAMEELIRNGIALFN